MGKEYIGATCPSCGAETLGYNEGKKKLTCTNCGFDMALPDNAFRVAEQPLSGHVFWKRLEMGLERAGKDFRCATCKSVISVDETVQQFHCPFCLSEEGSEEDIHSTVVRPAGIVPFNIPQKRALELLKKYIGRDLLFPPAIYEVLQPEHVRGVYVPYWGHKVAARATWYIFAGYKPTEEQEEWTDEELRWVPKNVYYEQTFEEVFIPASKGIAEKLLQQVFDMEEEEFYKDLKSKIVPFNEQYLEAFDCELYQKDLESGLKTVDGILDKKIEGSCLERAFDEGIQKHIPIDFPELPALSASKQGLAFRHVLLPVWLAVFKHNGKTYPFVVNGINGKTAGEKPFDKWRVLIAIGVAAVLTLFSVLLLDRVFFR
ncbi:MAG: hypothetical protein D6730_17185 [Bacteroidetes bacterium]|nr:MAG: hypothetical protein D6730_17185 [Bacteroidota bacterium]